MRTLAKWVLLTVTLTACTTSAWSAPVLTPAYKIVTASERGTYIRIGQDLALHVAPAAGIELEAVPSAGSVDNVRRLRFEPGVKLALVQSDVYQGYLDIADRGNPSAATLIRPLRVIMPLYNEEIYFVARADSGWNFVHEIGDARINAGELGSGTALTSATLYRLMFSRNLPAPGTTYFSNEEALVKLIGDKTVDVVAIVAGQPAKLLVDMKPEARQHIKLLKVDMDHASTQAALKTYFQATVRAASYPSLLSEDLPALAVKAFLVTFDFNPQGAGEHLRRFAQSLCQNFTTLREKGHPKWREVELALPPLGRGWSYYAVTDRELRNCAAKLRADGSAQARAVRACSQQEQILGLCR